MHWLRNARRAFHYVRPYWALALGSAGVTILLTGVALLAPWPIKIVVDSVLHQQPLPGLLHTLAGDLVDAKVVLLVLVVLAGFAITVITDALTVLATYLNTKLDLAMTLDFRSALFQHAQRLSMSYHDSRQSGMLIYVINGMAGSATRLVMTVLPLLQNVLTLAGMLWIAFIINSTLAVVALAIVPLLYYCLTYYTRRIQHRIYSVKMMEGETMSIIHEAISMLRVIVAFGREDHEYTRFRAQGEQANAARVDLTVRQTVFSLVVNGTIAAGTAGVLGTGAYLALRGEITVGELLVVLSYIASVYRPLEAISSTVGSLQDQFISLQMAFDVLDQQPDVLDAPGAVTLADIRGHLRFDRVSFNYTARTTTLREVSFELAPGTVTAIVGPTGAGKSTIVSLIARFYEPNAGHITLDGRDLRHIKLKSLRDQLSLVLQDTLLFSSTIAENIQYGRLDATRDDIMAAARAANAHDFIMALPNQYDTLVGERGAQLSGGERQRIGIARAFLKNAPILILDEPTSAIDARTEAVILDAIDRLITGRTTLLVTHRLATLRQVDRIIVLNHGEVIETGTHDALLAGDGLYRTLHDVQLRQRGRRRVDVVSGASAAH